MKNRIEWVEVTLVNGFKFLTPEERFEKMASNIGQMVPRLIPYNNAYILISKTKDVIRVKKKPDNKFRIHPNHIILAETIETDVEVIEDASL